MGKQVSARSTATVAQSVDAEIKADPFGYALRQLKRIDAQDRAAFDSFMTASRDAREAFDNAMRELRG